MFKQGVSLSRQKNDGCFFHGKMWNIKEAVVPVKSVFLKISENPQDFRRVFILKPVERPYVPLKNVTRDFKNSALFKNRHVIVSITGNLEIFPFLNIS